MSPEECTHWVTTVEGLRELIPTPKEPIMRKVRPHLEDSARAWIAASGLVAIARLQQDGTLDMTLHSQPKELAYAPDIHQAWMQCGAESLVGEIGDLGKEPKPSGALFLLRGMDSTLRVNGPLVRDEDVLSLAVKESFLHCPKAFVRSGFWEPKVCSSLEQLVPEEGASLGAQSRIFLEMASLAFLGTSSEDGAVDLSPRGDPAGFVRVLDDKHLFLPERPGNRIADSLRNILEYPKASFLVLCPGSDWVFFAQGIARITTEPRWLQVSEVRGKTPKLGIVLEVEYIRLRRYQAVLDSQLWNPTHYVVPGMVPSFGSAVVQQMEPDGKWLGLKGKVIDWMMRRDVKKNLY